MTTLAAFWMSASIAVAVAALVLVLLRGSLNAMLLELGGSVGRARFWSTFCSITIVLTCVIGMLASFPLSVEGGWAETPNVPTVLATLRTTLVFLLLALGALGSALLLGTSGHERRRRYELGARPDPPWMTPSPSSANR